MKPEVKIRNWAVVGSGDPYRAPEIDMKRLVGDVEDHPTLGKTNDLMSGPIQELDLKGRRVETINTIYLLEGAPNPAWVRHLIEIDYDLNRLPE
jgi:hypothetical protein